MQECVPDLSYGDSVEKPCLQPFSNGSKPRLYEDQKLQPSSSDAKNHAHPIPIVLNFCHSIFKKIRENERLSKRLFDNLLQVKPDTGKKRDDFPLTADEKRPVF